MKLRSTLLRPDLFIAIRKACSVVALLALIAVPSMMRAQTGGEGAMSGVVTDPSGAVVAGAKVTATNTATNVSTTRTSTSTGDYTISPIAPGLYSLQVSATGFKTLRQTNLTVNALTTLGFNAILQLGDASETVEVTAAPPVLDTTNATLGLVMENETYANLPIQINGGQRDPTAFASLAPGAQAGTRVPIVGGTGNFLGQLYLDGMPAETINQQGDNRLVSQTVDLDAVDQFQVVTSTPPAEYSGAGSENFTMKSGGNKYHGQVSDFVRNTIFDAWSFTSKAATVPTASGTKVPAPKPVEHQNELSITFGGKVPHTANKLFFFGAYDKFHSRTGANFSASTVPSVLMKKGDFTELNGCAGHQGLVGTGTNTVCFDGSSPGGTTAPVNTALIFDPTTNNCVLGVCTRQPFQGIKNGVPTYNVIPTGYLSPIALKMESFLPDPSNPTVLTGNYLGGYPGGFDNHLADYRVDFDLSARQRISTLGAIGTVRYLQNYGSSNLPLPYVTGTIANIFPKFFDVEDTFTINSHLVNQLKYSFTRFPQPQRAATDGMPQYAAAALGITLTGIPSGQATTEFPGVTFGTTGAVSTGLTAWSGSGGGTSTQTVVPSTYALLDNLQWQRGKHSLTLGFMFEWEQANSAIPVGATGLLGLAFNALSTAQYDPKSTTTLSTSSGNSYASFLLGAVGGSPSLGLQPVSEVGGRYHVISPYVQDTWKATRKLTMDIGLRWDYFTPYHEVKDRWSFFNPNLDNPATGTKGELQFAGNYGGPGVSCGCRTPVQTFWKNFGPRVGINYAVDDKTVFRVGGALVFSQAGGVGGRGGNAGGTGQAGFNNSLLGNAENPSGPTAGPSFYLNNGATFTGLGLANATFLPGIANPGAPAINAASQLINAGNYLNGVTATSVQNPGGVSYADPYFSGRAPEFVFFNAGFERSLTRNITLAVNYVGDQSHFLSTGGNVRGYWANQLDPKYLPTLGPLVDSTGKKPLLTAAATSANVAIAQGAIPGLTIPTFFQNAANANPGSGSLTVAQGLAAFPQYSGVTDLWGSNSANITYHSLQITLLSRKFHGLTYNVNYTFSKNIGDDGSFRSGFDIPASALSGGGQNWHQDRIDRSWTGVSIPENFHAFGVYELPFGKDHIGGNSMLVRTLAGGWLISGIYTYSSGTPIAITANHCSGTTFPLQGQCMPDITPGAKNARINGSYGTGPGGTTTCNLGLVPGCVPVKYLDASQFSQPAKAGSIYLIGNSPRTSPLTLRNPGNQNLDAAVHRSFTLPKELGTLVFEADCLNVWNKVTMNGPSGGLQTISGNTTGYDVSGKSGFGQIGGASANARDFQFAAHFNF